MTTISINPPPSNKRCDVCGKHISELKPFGKAGDPLVGDFDGALLIKIYRRMLNINDEIKQFDKDFEEIYETQKALDENKAFEKTEELLIKKYGEETYKGLSLASQLCSTVSSSWECRDCICLNDDDYLKKRNEVRENE